MAYNFTKISGVIRVTDTVSNTVPKSYFGAVGKFEPTPDNLGVNIQINYQNSFTVKLTDLKVNGQTPSTISEAMTLLNSLFGS